MINLRGINNILKSVFDNDADNLLITDQMPVPFSDLGDGLKTEHSQGKKPEFHSMIKFLLICPSSALEKIFNSQNMLYIPPVKNCFRLEFEQIP